MQRNTPFFKFDKLGVMGSTARWFVKTIFKFDKLTGAEGSKYSIEPTARWFVKTVFQV